MLVLSVMESEAGTPDSALELEDKRAGQGRKRTRGYPTWTRGSTTKWS